MRKSKPSVKYQGISMPIPFIEKIKGHIKDDDNYRSVADYVRQSVREKMEKEPVLHLSKSELTDMIRNVVTEILDKKEKK